MKPLSERDENEKNKAPMVAGLNLVGMKPLSERDENLRNSPRKVYIYRLRRNEATL